MLGLLLRGRSLFLDPLVAQGTWEGRAFRPPDSSKASQRPWQESAIAPPAMLETRPEENRKGSSHGLNTVEACLVGLNMLEPRVWPTVPGTEQQQLFPHFCRKALLQKGFPGSKHLPKMIVPPLQSLLNFRPSIFPEGPSSFYLWVYGPKKQEGLKSPDISHLTRENTM